MHELSFWNQSKLEMITGIKNRRVCAENEDSLELAVKAALSCFKYSSYNPSDIEMIVNCSISKYAYGIQHYYEPSLSLMIKVRIGNNKALNFDLSNACAGMITGVQVARSFIRQGIVSNCLLVSGECITSLAKNASSVVDSIHHPEVASLTLGDAGTAVILSRVKEKDTGKIKSVELKTISGYAHLCEGFQCSDSIGGFMYTDMHSIHKASISNAPSIIESALKNAGLTFGEIDVVIPHQTAKRSIDVGKKYFTNYFGSTPKHVIENLENYGNTASTTHFTTLFKLLKKGSLKQNSKVMLLSFASGIAIGAIIFEPGNLIERYGIKN